MAALGTDWQEVVALALVAMVALLVVRSFLITVFAEPLSAWLLKKGKVKAAFRLRSCCSGKK